MLRGMSWLVVVLAACVDSQHPLCTPPARTTYSCEPLPAGSPGCIGGPEWRPLGSVDDPIRQDDLDLIFPDQCKAEIPDCSPFYQGSPRAFECFNGSWGELL